MMRKSLIALAILSTMSAPLVAQTAPATNSAQPAKPQTVKKRICEQIDEDSYSRLGKRKICRTIEVPVTPTTGGQQSQAPTNPGTNG
jgi:hypothetical protein